MGSSFALQPGRLHYTVADLRQTTAGWDSAGHTLRLRPLRGCGSQPKAVSRTKERLHVLPFSTH